MLQELPDHLLSMAHTELVQIISGVYENFRETFEKIINADAVMFFPSIVRVIPGENESDEPTIDVHFQPIIVPVTLANALVSTLMKQPKMEPQEFADYLIAVYDTMALNTVLPAPTMLHPAFVQMFGTIVINGMPDKQHIVQKLNKLAVGDLIVIQIELTDTAVNTGMEVIPHALDVYDAAATMMKPSKTMH